MGKIQWFLWWTFGSSDNLTWANFGKQNWRWLPAPQCVHWKRPRVYVQNVPICTGTTRTCWNTCARGARTHGDVLNVHTGTFLNPHTDFSTFVQRAATHTHKPNTHDHQQHHDHNDTHHTTQHTTSRGDRETEKERQRQRETRQEGRRRWKRRDETRQEKRISEKIERREEERSKTRGETRWRSERRWKRKWRGQDEQGWQRRFFFYFRTLKPARRISPKWFKKKKPFGRTIPPFFFESSESDRFFSIIYLIRIRFFGQGDLIQNAQGPLSTVIAYRSEGHLFFFFITKIIGCAIWIQKLQEALKTSNESHQNPKPNYQVRWDPCVERKRKSRNVPGLVATLLIKKNMMKSPTQQVRRDPYFVVQKEEHLLDFRVPGLSHAVVKEAEHLRDQGLAKRIENHPHREALQADLQ